METGQLKSIVEAALLAYGNPLTVDQLRDLFEEFERPDAAAVRKALLALAEDCEGRPMELVEVAGGWRLQVRSRQALELGVNHYSAWNMVLDTVGRSLDTVRPWAQNAPLVVDVQARQLIVSPAYYVFRHVSQYADPGGKVVGTSSNDALAFKNPDGTIVATEGKDVEVPAGTNLRIRLDQPVYVGR